MNILIQLLIATVVVLAAAYIVPGVGVSGFWTAFIVAIVLGLLNTFLKPLLVLLSLPVTALTLGLFLFVINALIVLLAAKIVPGFTVSGFWVAMLFSIVVSLIGWLIASLDGR